NYLIDDADSKCHDTQQSCVGTGIQSHSFVSVQVLSKLVLELDELLTEHIGFAFKYFMNGMVNLVFETVVLLHMSVKINSGVGHGVDSSLLSANLELRWLMEC